VQVQQALARYGAALNVRVAAIYGGVAPGPQVQALSRGTDIVVAYLVGCSITFSSARSICQASRCSCSTSRSDARYGLLPPLRKILATVPRDRRTPLSATLEGEVLTARACDARSARVDVSPAQPSRQW
jgi:ATP-dependent RNA helicase RhlE